MTAPIHNGTDSALELVLHILRVASESVNVCGMATLRQEVVQFVYSNGGFGLNVQVAHALLRLPSEAPYDGKPIMPDGMLSDWALCL